MSDRLEPIRRAFRQAGLYHHAADDLLCGQLADAAAPPAAERDEAPVDLLAALDAARGEAVATVTSSNTAMTFSVVTPGLPEGTKLYAAPPTAAVPASDPPVMELIGKYWDLGFTEGKTGVNQADAANEVLHQISRALAQQPAAAVPEGYALVPDANVTPMRQPRADLARLVESINAAVYANGDGLSVTEAIGALELAKLELLKEQEQ